MSDLSAVILAAGAGTRLRPLTDIRPKALCPVNNVPLVDLAIARARPFVSRLAVNVHHGRAQMEEHLEGRAHLSIEDPKALGTAGALGKLRDWIDGGAVLVCNADAWHRDDLKALVEGWDGERVRLLVIEDPERADFEGGRRYIGSCLLPWRSVKRLEPVFSGLYEEVFAGEELDLCLTEERFFDCGTPTDYHAANMTASGGENVVGEGVRVEGEIERCVVWPGAAVGRHEHLVDAIRANHHITVFAR